MESFKSQIMNLQNNITNRRVQKFKNLKKVNDELELVIYFCKEWASKPSTITPEVKSFFSEIIDEATAELSNEEFFLVYNSIKKFISDLKRVININKSQRNDKKAISCFMAKQHKAFWEPKIVDITMSYVDNFLKLKN